ncbi:MAG: ABC transporter ATP-binding protein [Oscillospiraceae bacterium]|nr:ABC transporter ATP-binding protein [Oscillospiraceae bacterium]
MEILKVENLRKTYGKKETQTIALDGISFSVDRGEFVAVIGASGSGKSTLLYSIGGIDKPTSGSITVDGEDLLSLNQNKLAVFRRNKMGFVYQFYNLIPVLTVKENICLPILLGKNKVDEQKFNEIIEVLGLEKRINHLPNQLSGGEQQRVSIGRALINNPSIILADEPTGNLDSKNSAQILNLFKKCNHDFNQTIIIVTHDEKISNQVGRVITVADGKIAEEKSN